MKGYLLQKLLQIHFPRKLSIRVHEGHGIFRVDIGGNDFQLLLGPRRHNELGLGDRVKEGFDDFLRYRRDKDINRKRYTKVAQDGSEVEITSERIRVGDIIKVNQNQRIPADMVMIYTTEEFSGTVFIRTDQLDGETDWKLRRSINAT